MRDCGLAEIDSAWGGYTHHTDSWIFREVFRHNTGRVPGAAAFLRALAASDEYTVAFATGGMREVTAAKPAPLGAAGAVTTASDHTFREHVVREAIHQAGDGFDRVVSVGDRPSATTRHNCSKRPVLMRLTQGNGTPNSSSTASNLPEPWARWQAGHGFRPPAQPSSGANRSEMLLMQYRWSVGVE
ncbi:hypothetical protein ACFV2U_32370 [Streptomyces sp. NPDC059697]|uniref:hypothetical protein n=1 Tax=Streptomyces sp. NPDC059697 TaxID=3346912 RepID=UPI00369D1103